jgi:hypothetical protein
VPPEAETFGWIPKRSLLIFLPPDVLVGLLRPEVFSLLLISVHCLLFYARFRPLLSRSSLVVVALRLDFFVWDLICGWILGVVLRATGSKSLRVPSSNFSYIVVPRTRP